MASATATHPAETKAPGPKHNIEAMREEYYQRIAKHGMTPLWKVMSSVVTKEPVTRCQPVIWHYDDIKRLVMESGGLITAEEAERRVLILENPGMRGESRATNTLFAGVQMILPGEVAPGAPARLVGDPLRARRRGRLHRGRGREGLHVARRLRHHRELGAARPRQHLGQADAVARRARLSAGQLLRSVVRRAFRGGDAVDQPGGRRLARLLRLRRAAGRRARAHEPQPGHQLHLRPHAADHRAHDEGRRHRQAPWRARALRQSRSTAARCCPPWAPSLALLPKGFKGEKYRSTDGTIFVCAEGKGTTTVDGKVLEWGPNDVFVVPPWKHFSHNAEKESVLFSISDRPSQEALGIWREDTAHALGQVRASCARLGHRAELTDPGHPGSVFCG